MVLKCALSALPTHQLTRKNQTQPKLSGIWVCPKATNVDVARLDISVRAATGDAVFTAPYDNGVEDRTAIGWTSLFAAADRRLVMTKTEGTTGVTGDGGW